jgi:hypothetical protein
MGLIHSLICDHTLRMFVIPVPFGVQFCVVTVYTFELTAIQVLILFIIFEKFLLIWLSELYLPTQGASSFFNWIAQHAY